MPSVSHSRCRRATVHTRDQHGTCRQLINKQQSTRLARVPGTRARPIRATAPQSGDDRQPNVACALTGVGEKTVRNGDDTDRIRSDELLLPKIELHDRLTEACCGSETATQPRAPGGEPQGSAPAAPPSQTRRVLLGGRVRPELPQTALPPVPRRQPRRRWQPGGRSGQN